MLAILVLLRTPNALASTELAGLTLGMRGVLTLQKAGASRLVLVAEAEDAALAEEIRRDARVRVPVESVVRPAGASPLGVALSCAGETALVARSDVLVDPATYTVLATASIEPGRGVVARGRSGDDKAVFGPILVPAGLGATLGNLEGELDGAIERGIETGALRVLDSPFWAEAVADPAGRRRAFNQLFEACRKPVDGVVSRHLNRHVSIFVSKRLVGTPVTPNMVSLFTLTLGVLAGISVARGGYGPTLLGAFLWQLNSILDGVDGELARVRFQHSRVGQWLDTISDDASNVIFWAALAMGSAGLPFGHWLVICGWVAAGSNFALAIVYYTELVSIGSGDVYDIIGGADQGGRARGLMGWIGLAARTVTKKDFFVLFCFVLAALGVLNFILPVLALAGAGVLVSAVVRAAKRRGAVRARS